MINIKTYDDSNKLLSIRTMPGEDVFDASVFISRKLASAGLDTEISYNWLPNQSCQIKVSGLTEFFVLEK
jgi:hypothetical protein